ncbi:MAG TPA: BON domain-containing protein [Candidatus Angelobacter sp.]|jgi:osmotically-inducible protein OsmY
MSGISLFVLCAALAAFTGNQQQPPDAHPSAHDSSQSQPAPQPSPARDQTEANRRIHDSIDDLMSSDPVLSGSHVEVDVDDHNVTLTGSVESHVQHQRVLQLAAQYSRWRNIVDKLKPE